VLPGGGLGQSTSEGRRHLGGVGVTLGYGHQQGWDARAGSVSSSPSDATVAWERDRVGLSFCLPSDRWKAHGLEGRGHQGWLWAGLLVRKKSSEGEEIEIGG
jgi:hypothetical protein